MNLAYLSATEAIEQFKNRSLSPIELLDAVIVQTEKTQPRVNALTEQLLEEAYHAAREAEDRYAGHGPAPRALEGIPLLLKEEHLLTGRTIEGGSLLLQGQLAPVQHPVVDRVLGAGAVVHGRTTMPEFCCITVTHSKLWGVTRNPWNLDITPGGSSGGAGAALAAGMSTLATGSDIGGSIRIPAAQCGVVGFKPPAGRVPGLPPFNFDHYCSDGPMGRSVADVALLQNVLAGPSTGDPATLRPKLELPSDLGAVGGLKVALCLNLGDYPVDDAVLANTRAAADALRAAGVTVDEVALPWTREQILDIAWTHLGPGMGAFAGQVLDDAVSDLVMDYTKEFARAAIVPRDYGAGLAAEVEFYRPLAELLESYDALLAPTVGAPLIPAEAQLAADPIPFSGGEVSMYDAVMTMPFNIIGRCPVLSVPSGIGAAGVPTGVQIVGRTYDDTTVFHLGAALERTLGLTTTDTWRPAL